jgi:hypothetical protein
MGKYDEVIKNLGKLGEAPRSERVEKLREEYRSMSLAELAKKYTQLRKERDAADQVVKGINEQVDAICSLMEPLYESSGVSALKVRDVGTVSIQLHPHAVVEDREKFRLWCIKAGLERQMTIPWQTADAMTKECLLQGLPEPDGIKAYIRTSFRFLKERS